MSRLYTQVSGVTNQRSLTRVSSRVESIGEREKEVCIWTVVMAGSSGGGN